MGTLCANGYPAAFARVEVGAFPARYNYSLTMAPIEKMSAIWYSSEDCFILDESWGREY